LPILILDPNLELTPRHESCQICEKAARDENAFKMHCQSESHTRKALEVGRDFKGTQEQFSKEFESNFIQLLKTAHGEKEIHANKYVARPPPSLFPVYLLGCGSIV